MKQTSIRINRVSVRLRDGGASGATEVGARVAAQLVRRAGVRFPQALQNDLAGRLACALPKPGRK